MTYIKETTIKNGRKRNRLIKAINKEAAMKDILNNFEKMKEHLLITFQGDAEIIEKKADFVSVKITPIITLINPIIINYLIVVDDR